MIKPGSAYYYLTAMIPTICCSMRGDTRSDYQALPPQTRWRFFPNRNIESGIEPVPKMQTLDVKTKKDQSLTVISTKLLATASNL